MVMRSVLTEASNLLPSGSDALKRRLMAALRRFIVFDAIETLITPRTEHYVPSANGVSHSAFLPLGLTDATLLAGAFDLTTLLTDDLEPYPEASHAGREVEYFTYSLRDVGLL